MKWYTPIQVAKELGVGVNRVRGWIPEELNAVNVGDGDKRPRWRISQQALDDFLESRTPPPRLRKRTRRVLKSTGKDWF